jgi:hypothetical protein
MRLIIRMISRSPYKRLQGWATQSSAQTPISLSNAVARRLTNTELRSHKSLAVDDNKEHDFLDVALKKNSKDEAFCLAVIAYDYCA